MERISNVLVEVRDPLKVKATSVPDWETKGCPSCGCKFSTSDVRTNTTDLMICHNRKCLNRHYVVIDDDYGKNKISEIGFVVDFNDLDRLIVYPEIP